MENNEIKNLGWRMDAPEYNSKVITEFAARLYSRAKWCVLRYIAVYAFIGGVIGNSFIGDFINNSIGNFIQDPLLPFMMAIVLGILGYSIGMEKTFRLRLEAQTALCQREIAKNTEK